MFQPTKRKRIIMSKKNKAKNLALIAKGKVKETAGSAVGNPGLESEGRDDQASGHMKQAGEQVKDALKD
jgi:uncharacterized protein YjbJ (UPF0337 family)